MRWRVFVALLVGAIQHGMAAAQPKLPAAASDRIVVRLKDGTVAGTDSLGRLAGELGVRRVRPLLPAPARTRGALRAAVTRSRFADRARRAVSRGAPPDVDHTVVIELPAGIDVRAAAARYAADGHVLYAHPDYLLRSNTVPLPSVPAVPDDPYIHAPGARDWSAGAFDQDYPDLWGLQKTHAIEAWNRFGIPFQAGSGVTVAVVDTGLDALQPDIVGGVWTNPDEIPGNGLDDDGNGLVDDVNGWDFTTTQYSCDSNTAKPPDADPFDDHGHGTHVSGTIAARANNGLSIAGIAPGARIMPVKGLDADGCGFSSDIAAAIVYAADEGADVINLSLGGPASGIIEDAVAYAHGLGVVVVVSAGNAHENTAGPVRFGPADTPHAITVAASDELDLPTYFSNYGEKIDVVAPGGGDPLVPPDPPGWNILSLRSSGARTFGSNDFLYKIKIGPDILRLGGTSMAAPHVSGLAALVLAHHPAFTTEEVRQAIRVSAEDVGAIPGFDVDTGAGRIDADAAVSVDAVLTAFLDSPGGGAVRTPVAFHGTAAGPGFARWEILVGAGLVPATFTQIAASTTPVVDGTLFVWAPNEGQYPEGRYAVILRAVDASGRIFETRHNIVLNHHALPGWPVSDAFAPTIVAVGDVNAVPGDEVVTAGGNVLDRWTSHGEHLGALPFSDTLRWLPTVADLDGDGRLETLIGSPQGLVVVDGDAVTTIGSDNLGVMLSGAATPVVADDLDGDGSPEIVTLSVDGYVTVRDHAGAVLPGWPQRPIAPIPPATGVVNTDLAVGDIDGDGQKEILYGAIGWITEPFRLLALRLDGSLMWIRDMAPGQPPGSPLIVGTNDVVLGDVDDDGDFDVVFATRDVTGNHFFVLDGAGTVVHDWLVPFFEASIGSPPDGGYGAIQGPHPILVDLDGDGDLEIVTGANTPGDDGEPFLYAWHHTGALVSGFPSQHVTDAGYQIYDYLVAGDVDGDGGVDLVSATAIGNAGARLYAWSRSGQLLPGWPKTFQSVSTNGLSLTPNLPALVDLDHDGRLDLVVSIDQTEVTAEGLHIPVSSGALQWPQYRHDGGRTGRYERPRCGNGVLEPGEACDDGNGVSCDGCSGTCTLDGPAVCGDGAVSLCGEACDDGNLTSGDGCDANCTPTGCGNGIVTAGEECDDGNIDPYDGCTTACTQCGDGVVTPPEECDDGNADAADGCTNACTRCGDGVVSAPEACDDGNRTNGDCCTTSCTIEPNGSTCSDDGSPCTVDKCDATGCFHRPDSSQCGYFNPYFGVGIPTASLVLYDPQSANPGAPDLRRLTFKAVDKTSQDRIVIPERGSVIDPVEHGAVLRVFRPGPYGDSWSRPLYAEAWKTMGADTAPKGYRYKLRDSGLKLSVILKRDALTIKVKTGSFFFPYSLDEVAQGQVAVSLGLGLTTEIGESLDLCAVAYARRVGSPPSTGATDLPGKFIGGPSPPPAECPTY